MNNFAVGDKNGTARLSTYAPGYEVFASLESSQRHRDKIVGFEEVRTIVLDDDVRQKNIPRVDFLKIDVEGAELFALRCAKALLSGDAVPIILLELADVNAAAFGCKAIEVWDFLRTVGYRMYSLGSPKGGLTEITRPEQCADQLDLVAAKHQP